VPPAAASAVVALRQRRASARRMTRSTARTSSDRASSNDRRSTAERAKVIPRLVYADDSTSVLLIGSRRSDHYFRSVCWFVCLFVCAEFFSAVFDPISMKLGHVLYVWV